MKNKTIFAWIAGTVATLLTASALATPVVFCSNGGIDLIGDGCISGESRFYPGGGDGYYSNTGGGDPEAKVEEAIFLATGDSVDITFHEKLETLAGSSGSWTSTGDVFIAYITIKAANSFALYQLPLGTSSGSWSTAGILNNGGNQPGISHLSLWLASTPPDDTPVPAPGVLALMSLGLLLMRLGRRRSHA